MDTYPPVRVYYELDDGEWYDEAFTRPFQIGRDPSCEVCVTSTFVSRQHAEVVFEGGAWWLSDLGSTNGLWLGEEKVERLQLAGHTLVQLGWEGPLLHLKVEKSKEPEAPPPPERAAPPRDATPEPKEPAPEKPYWLQPEPPGSGLDKTTPEPAKPEKKPFWLDAKPGDGPEPLWPSGAALPVQAPGSTGLSLQESSPAAKRAPDREASAPAVPPPEAPAEAPAAGVFKAHRFTMPLEPGWHEATMYYLTGPVLGGIRHNILITRENDVEETTVSDYASLRTTAMASRLNGCMILRRDEVVLAAGLPASRVIYGWSPEEGLRLYQEQVYVLHDGSGYTLTASFTRQTRKKLGHDVEQVMLSFKPEGVTP